MLFSRVKSLRLRDAVRVKVVVAVFFTAIPILVAFVFPSSSEEFHEFLTHFAWCFCRVKKWICQQSFIPTAIVISVCLHNYCIINDYIITLIWKPRSQDHSPYFTVTSTRFCLDLYKSPLYAKYLINDSEFFK